jgi:nucleotide-binding universal stress UspA family protein
MPTFRHILGPIDCSDDSRRLAASLVEFATLLVPCKITLIAAVTPTDDAELQGKRRNHANTALLKLHAQMQQYGIWTRTRVVEGEDPIAAFVAEGAQTKEIYDLMVLGTHQTLPEDMEAPCRGSFADRLCQKTTLPVLVLPSRHQACPS